jgi:hypothetical protein
MMEAAAHPTEMRGWRHRWRYRLASWRVRLREWLLEDGANRGLGGPPNNWQSIKIAAESYGGNADYSARFGDDASSIMIWVRYTDEQKGDGRWLADFRPAVFRRMALWYLWRWAYGEWFGLRRWVYYRWLRRHVAKMTQRRHA